MKDNDNLLIGQSIRQSGALSVFTYLRPIHPVICTTSGRHVGADPCDIPLATGSVDEHVGGR